jgi:hypothetical protein
MQSFFSHVAPPTATQQTAINHTRDKNAPCFRAIHGNFCPRLQPTFTMHLAIYTAIPDHSLVIRHIFPPLCQIADAILPHSCHTLQCNPSLSDPSLHPWPSWLPWVQSVLFLSWHSQSMTNYMRQFVSKCYARLFVSKCHATHCAACYAACHASNNENKQMIARTHSLLEIMIDSLA